MTLLPSTQIFLLCVCVCFPLTLLLGIYWSVYVQCVPKVQATVVGFLASIAAVIFGWIPEGHFRLGHAVLLCAASVATAFIASLLLGMALSHSGRGRREIQLKVPYKGLKYINMYMYMYMCMNVCICVCVWGYFGLASSCNAVFLKEINSKRALRSQMQPLDVTVCSQNFKILQTGPWSLKKIYIFIIYLEFTAVCASGIVPVTPLL